MNTEEKLKELILSEYKSVQSFAASAGVKYQTVMSILNRGVVNASVSNIIKICTCLGISADELADGKIVPSAHANAKRDVTDIEDVVNLAKLQIADRKLTLNGKPLDEEDKQLFVHTLDIGLELLKKKCLG